jgi:hypothetical protein
MKVGGKMRRCDLQIFLCPANGNVTRVPCAVTLKTETSGVRMTLGNIVHRLELSSTEVTFGAIHCDVSSSSDPTSPDSDQAEAPLCSRLLLQKMRKHVTNIVMKRMFTIVSETLIQGISVAFDLHPEHIYRSTNKI